jgi:hypothetical protein
MEIQSKQARTPSRQAIQIPGSTAVSKQSIHSKKKKRQAPQL